MLVISSELEKFYNTVNNSTGTMSSSVSNLSQKLSLLGSASKIAKKKIDQCYSSNNKSSIIRRLESMINIISDVETSVSSDLSGIVSKATSICSLVEEMKEEKTAYDSATSSLNTERAKEERDYSKISYYLREQRDAQDKFTEKETEAKKLYNQLFESIGLEFIEKYQNAEYLNHLDMLNWGSFVEAEPFKASNGETVYYYIYVPDYGMDVEGLPLHVYMHGSGETGRGVLNCGLPKEINERQVIPEGVVLCLQAKTTGDFYRGTYFDAVEELINSTVEKYNCNPDKVSASGHSMGACGAYKMIAAKPDLFSAFVPISGLNYNYDGVAASNVKIWQMHGSDDGNCEYRNAVQVYNYLHDRMDIFLHTFKGESHCIQNQIFVNEFDDWGESMNPLTWAMRQDRTSSEVLLG